MGRKYIEGWEDKQEFFCFEEFAKKWLQENQPDFSFVSLEIEENSVNICWRLNMKDDNGIEYSKWWYKCEKILT